MTPDPFRQAFAALGIDTLEYNRPRPLFKVLLDRHAAEPRAARVHVGLAAVALEFDQARLAEAHLRHALYLDPKDRSIRRAIFHMLSERDTIGLFLLAPASFLIDVGSSWGEFGRDRSAMRWIGRLLPVGLGIPALLLLFVWAVWVGPIYLTWRGLLRAQAAFASELRPDPIVDSFTIPAGTAVVRVGMTAGAAVIYWTLLVAAIASIEASPDFERLGKTILAVFFVVLIAGALILLREEQ